MRKILAELEVLAETFEEYKKEHPGTKKTKATFEQKAQVAHAFSSEAHRYNKDYGGSSGGGRDKKEHKYLAKLFRDHAERIKGDPNHKSRSPHPDQDDSSSAWLNECADFHDSCAKGERSHNPYQAYQEDHIHAFHNRLLK